MWSDREGFLILNIHVQFTACKGAVSRFHSIRLELEIMTGLDAFDLERHVT